MTNNSLLSHSAHVKNFHKLFCTKKLVSLIISRQLMYKLRNNWNEWNDDWFLTVFLDMVHTAHQKLTSSTHLTVRHGKESRLCDHGHRPQTHITHLLNCLAQSWINCNSFRSIDSTSVTRADTSVRNLLFSSSKLTTLSCRHSQLSNSDVLSLSRYPDEFVYELLIDWSEVSHNEASSFDSRSAL